jgi:hypothetical protein
MLFDNNFYLLLASPNFKTIHNTDITRSVTPHDPVFAVSHKIDFKKYFIIHFRTYDMRERPRAIQMNNFFFDYNYYFCYFKPVYNLMIDKVQLTTHVNSSRVV